MNAALGKLVKPLAVVVALLLAGGVYAITGGLDKKDDTYRVTAYFTKAIGLFENSDVTVLGVAVGKVTNVEPVGTRVRVDMDISKEHMVPANASAQIVPISVISDRYVQLDPPYTGGETLPDGAVLDVDRTKIPAELDDVFLQLKKLLEAIEPGKEGEPGALGDLVVQLDRTLAGHEQDLRGTLIHGARLTDTLADAEEDISGLLINLDEMFETLATRAGSFGELNRNFALVMAALAESRDDLHGTLANLGTMTEEVGDLIKDNRGLLDQDLARIARITRTVLKNRASVKESLAWLPVVGEGLMRAYNPNPVDATDVRDNATQRVECEVLDTIPDGPIKDALEEICRQETGEPPDDQPVFTPPPRSLPELKLDCDEGVRKVKRQIRRLGRMSIDDEVRDEILEPLSKKLKKLAKKCRELGQAIDDELLDRLKELTGDADLDDLDDLEDLDLDDLENLTGNAAGAAAVPEEEQAGESGGGWIDGLLDFVGLSR
ncbi:MAG TPA: MCE family protein [Actinomycetota bacterium]|nr:MCE family protein [Actinomycetota bacterium]